LRNIEKAAQITAEIFRDTRKYIKPGISEAELAGKLESRIRKNGLKRSFRTIVASGANAAKPHAVPTKRRIKKRDTVVVDFGVIYRGEHSDMTRTVLVGKPAVLAKRAYRAVKDAQAEAIGSVRAGVKISYLAKLSHDVLRRRGFGRNILHSLGHGIGKRVHEPPKVSEKNGRTLKAGTVITIEPGLYFRGRGGLRIEDMALVTKKGKRLLTRG